MAAEAGRRPKTGGKAAVDGMGGGAAEAAAAGSAWIVAVMVDGVRACQAAAEAQRPK